MSEKRYATCTLCEATCGIEVEIEANRVLSVRGDDNDPFSRGHVCPKVVGMKELQEDPERLRRPVLRTPGGFEEIEWEEAWDLAARLITAARDAGGADAIAFYRGNPTIHDFSAQLAANVFARTIGTRNVFSAGPNDTWPKVVQSGSMYGHGLRQTVPDIDRTNYFFVIGANPVVSNGSLMTAPGIKRRLKELRARGGKLVVVDPRRTETARFADEHVFVRPGGDAALLLAIVHVLFEESLVDLGDVGELTTGLEEVERITRDFGPDAVEDFCGVPAATIRRLARELAGATSAAVYGRLGICVQEFGTLASWGVDLLAILTGNLDRPGGSMFPLPAAPLQFGRTAQFGRFQSRVSGRDEVNGEFPAVVLAEEIEASGVGQVRALVTVAGNPVRSYPNSGRLERAIEGLDAMISLDFYVNETTRHANLIIPPNGPLERQHYDLALQHFTVRNIAKWGEPVLEPDPRGRDSWTTVLEICSRLSGPEVTAKALDARLLEQFAARALSVSRFKDRLDVGQVVAAVRSSAGGDALGAHKIVDAMIRVGPWGDGCGLEPEGLCLERLRKTPHGHDLGPLVPLLPEALNTESGTILLAPERLVADVPRLKKRLAGGSDDSLRLINRRDVRSMNSWLHNLPALAKGPDRCTLLMHPIDAQQRGLRDGDRASIHNTLGTIDVPVEITDDVMPGVVSLPHGFGHTGDGLRMTVAAAKPGADVNAVTVDADTDVPSGASILFGGRVDVVAAPETGP